MVGIASGVIYFVGRLSPVIRFLQSIACIPSKKSKKPPPTYNWMKACRCTSLDGSMEYAAPARLSESIATTFHRSLGSGHQRKLCRYGLVHQSNRGLTGWGLREKVYPGFLWCLAAFWWLDEPKGGGARLMLPTFWPIPRFRAFMAGRAKTTQPYPYSNCRPLIPVERAMKMRLLGEKIRDVV